LVVFPGTSKGRELKDERGKGKAGDALRRTKILQNWTKEKWQTKNGTLVTILCTPPVI